MSQIDKAAVLALVGVVLLWMTLGQIKARENADRIVAAIERSAK
jgi:uncharacterized membrane protein